MIFQLFSYMQILFSTLQILLIHWGKIHLTFKITLIPSAKSMITVTHNQQVLFGTLKPDSNTFYPRLCVGLIFLDYLSEL